MKTLSQVSAQAALEEERCEANIQRELTSSEKLAFEIGYKAGYAAACGDSGRVQTVQAPYCPNCEEEPDWRGSPILVGMGVRANS